MKRTSKLLHGSAALALSAVIALPLLQGGAFAATAATAPHPRHAANPAVGIMMKVENSASLASFLHLNLKTLQGDRMKQHKTLLSLATAVHITRAQLLTKLDALAHVQVVAEGKTTHLTATAVTALNKQVDALMAQTLDGFHLGHFAGNKAK